ncbi:MAG: DMT family transporter [Burkholderiaceae bacterium]
MLLRYGALALGVLIVSTAALLIRWAIDAGAHPLTVAAARLTLAAALIAPVAWLRRSQELRSLGRADWSVAALSGVLLAVHFATWIASLVYTSVASSVALVTTNPVWVGLAAWLILREPPSRSTLMGILLAAAGTACILLSDVQTAASAPAGREPMLGNGLALLGAISISGYLLVGRRLNLKLSLLAYIAIVYGAAAIAMNLIAWGLGHGIESLPWAALAPIVLLALGPQLAGHTLINASLRHLTPTFVALAILGEPVGSAILAWLLLGESVAGLQLLGFVVLLGGIVVAARGER